MTPDDAEEYTASLGQIVAGSWRQVAWADRQGIPAALGLTTREWVERRLGGYVRLAIPERREAVAELTEEGLSQREVANVLGVDQATVQRDAFASRSEEEQPEQLRADAVASPEDLEERRRERERTEAIARQVNRLRNVIDGWPTISNLHTSPLRTEVLAALATDERRLILTIEETTHA
jgi:predicted transcriptional regulator